MHDFTRVFLAALMLCLPSLAHAGGYCGVCRPTYSYVKPVYAVAAAPIIKQYPTNTWNYSYSITYPQAIPSAVQGATQYGYVPPSYQAVAQDQLGDPTTIGLAAVNAGLRLGDNSLQMVAYGSGIGSEIATNNARIQAQRLSIQERQTNAIALERISKAISPTPPQISVTQSPVYAQSTTVQGVTVAAGQQAIDVNTLATIHATYCASCHANAEVAATKGGKAVIPPFDQLDVGQRKIVRDRIATHDAAKRMPRGLAIPDAELSLLLDVLCK